MAEWGPLATPAGDWEGDDGLDVSYHNAEAVVGETRDLEKVQLKPSGPVDNGKQCLYGLGYRMAAWAPRGGGPESLPHRRVGYWMWDAADRQVMRCFMIPRATVLIAGTTCEPDAREFTLTADPGERCYGIREPLPRRARQRPALRVPDHRRESRLLELRGGHGGQADRPRGPGDCTTSTATRSIAWPNP